MKAIEFENIGKQYRLGLVSTRTISHDLNRWWAMNVLHKEDPYLKIGETNDRSHKGLSEYVWALKDINFSVEESDVVGIIGKNGAGKSTLLKLLSRVTTPTTGTIKARGRIASLLEVGTGFHPEMTGRENIYMNGAIMGMTKQEITRKLDEIVDFSGCERYIDTPVKRYSSGMTVRLGFSIAAHLEPEILVVDEVLAVGDAEFQKKAIGKMQDVAKGEGRTVLFVSHNMAAVRNLCRRGVVLNNGGIVYMGMVNDAVDFYLHNGVGEMKLNGEIKDSITKLLPYISIDYISFNNQTTSETTIASNQEYVQIAVVGHTSLPIKADLSFVIKNLDEVPIAAFSEGHFTGKTKVFEVGDFKIEKLIKLPRYIFHGDCTLDICMHQPNVVGYMDVKSCVLIHFEGSMDQFGRAEEIKQNGLIGLVSTNVSDCL